MGARRLAPVIALLLIATVAAAGQDAADRLVLQTRTMRLALDPSGRVVELADRASGRDVRAPGAPEPFVTVRVAGAIEIPKTVTRSGERLVFGFGRPGLSVELRIGARPTYLVVVLDRVAGDAVQEVEFCRVRVNLAPHFSDMAGIASDGRLACALRVVNPLAGVRAAAGPAPTLAATWTPNTGLSGVNPAGAAAALALCLADRMRGTLKELLRREHVLTSPTGGPFALDAPENRGSYVFAFGLSEKNADEWIRLAKQAGLAELHLIGWEKSLGHYEPNPQYFPHGMDGLKEVIRKIHAAGLKAGMHTLTGLIGPNDAFITPTPDSRLWADASFTLAAPLDAAGTALTTAEAPANLDVIWAYGSRGNVLRVDDELIQYGAYSGTAPFGFSKCIRGAFGTRPAPHAAGARVHHLGVYAGCFLPNEKTSLIDDIATHIAAVFNACGFDMIYMDGAEGTPGGWWGVYRMRAAIFERLKRRVLVEASEWGYHSWPFHSRIGAWDYPNWGLKEFVDIHCRSNEEVRATSFMPAELGWWCIFGPNEDRYAQLPDEIEYLFCKALAFDMPLSFQGIGLGAPENLRQPQYLEMLGRYERLRLGRRVPAPILAKLRTPGQDYRLVGSRFVPTDYLTHRVTGSDDGSDSWSVMNRYATQPLRLRIQALYSAAPFASPAGIPLQTGGKGTAAPEASAGTAASLAPAGERTPDGDPCLTFAAKGPGGRGAWARAMTAFDPPLDLSTCGALGVWVKGDGKGAVLNLQLTNPTQYWPTFDEHYVKLDFVGWRYVELHLRERDASAYGAYVWPYGDTYSVYRDPLIRSAVNGLNFYLNNLPSVGSTACSIGPVRALPTVAAKLANPSVTVGGRTMTFPVTLESGQVLEYDSPGDCRLYDERGKLLGRVQVQGEAPTLAAGRSAIHFGCTGTPGLRSRANVTLIVSGDPLE